MKNRILIFLKLKLEKNIPFISCKISGTMLKITVVDQNIQNSLDGVDEILIETKYCMPRMYVKNSPYRNLQGIELADKHYYPNNEKKNSEYGFCCIGTYDDFLSNKTDCHKAEYLFDAIWGHITILRTGSALTLTQPHA